MLHVLPIFSYRYEILAHDKADEIVKRANEDPHHLIDTVNDMMKRDMLSIEQSAIKDTVVTVLLTEIGVAVAGHFIKKAIDKKQEKVEETVDD